MTPLGEYRKKREFRKTPEPEGRPAEDGKNIFVVQRHAARRLHFDFRLAIDGVLKSWAVPKGPPTTPGEKRLAVHVEDHPLEYAKFEGEIPKGNYGAGDVRIWDRGHFEVLGPPDAMAQMERGDFKFRLEGEKLHGPYVLVKMRHSERGNEWLLIKKPETDEDKHPAPEARVEKKSTAGKSGDPGALPGAAAAPIPSQVNVALSTLEKKAFSDPDWLYEIKWDGERALVWIRDGEIEIRSRSNRSITHEAPELSEIVKRMDARQAILDGEIVALDDAGRPDFKKLQRRFGVQNPSPALRREVPVSYYAFDLLYCDGYDLRNVPLEKRKALLQQRLAISPTVRFSDHQLEKGEELLALARQRGLEGIVAKRRDSPYVEGRSRAWIKFKIVHDVDVVIGGWTAPRNSRGYFGALLMGLYRGEELEYVGSVGTGFTQQTLQQTHEMLRPLKTPRSAFRVPPKLKEDITWVTPQLVARIHYAEWTEDRRLRAPVFIGFRDDVPPESSTFDDQTPPAAKSAAGRAAGDSKASIAAAPPKSPTVKRAARRTAKSRHARNITSHEARSDERGKLDEPDKRGGSGGHEEPNAHAELRQVLERGSQETLPAVIDGKKLTLTHLNKIFFPEAGYRKRDLLAYYLLVAPYILPFLKDRPLVLKRYPNGIHGKYFFQKEAPASRPDWLKTVSIYSRERQGKMSYLVADDTAALLHLTNLGCIDHNPWSSRWESELVPDYLFFDLDPTEGTSFDAVRDVARATHKHLESRGARSYLKTSGATGFHIYIPLQPKYTYEQVRMFAEAIGQLVKADLPKLVTFKRQVSARPRGTVLIDAAQNAHGKPLASVYSVRPFPGAPVSTPILADELSGLRPQALNIGTLAARLRERGDLWHDFWEHRQKLEDLAK